MNYDDMKELMRLLDLADIPYEFGNHYNTEYLHDGTTATYIDGHWIIVGDTEVEVWDIDDEDEKWNRG